MPRFEVCIAGPRYSKCVFSILYNVVYELQCRFHSGTSYTEIVKEIYKVCQLDSVSPTNVCYDYVILFISLLLCFSSLL